MATDKNFKVKNGIQTGGQVLITAPGTPSQLVITNLSTSDYSLIRLNNSAGVRALELMTVGTTATPGYGIPAGAVGLNASGTTGLYFSTADTARLIIDGSGNVGVGVTPSAWQATWKVMEINAAGSAIGSDAVNSLRLTAGLRFVGSSWLYTVTGSPVTAYSLNGGAHIWGIASSGTSGNSATLTQAMMLNASGDLGIGTTTPSSFGHGGTNRVIQVHNSGTAVNSQSHVILTSGIAVPGATSIGSITWALPGISTGGLGMVSYVGSGTAATHTVANPAGYLVLGTKGAVDSTVIERMRLDSVGNLGLGTSSPAAKFEVNGGAILTTLTSWNSGANTVFTLANAAVRLGIGYDASDMPLIQGFDTTNGSRNIVLQPYGGNVGIGAAPGYKLDVSSTSQNNPVVRIIKANSGTGNEHGGALIIANQGPANLQRASGTYGGRIVFQYSQPTSQALQDGASIYSAADGAQNGTATPAFLGFCTSDTTAGGSNQERMRIDSSGIVSIGAGSTSFTNRVVIRLTAAETVNGLSVIRDFNSTNTYGAIGLGMSQEHVRIEGYGNVADNSVGTAVFKVRSGGGLLERMRIDSNGNVMIGSSTNVQGIITAKGTIACIDSSESYLGQFAASAGVTSISGYSATGQALALMTTPSGSGAVERVRIKATGEVGIGTNNPTYPLDVVGAMRVSGSAQIGTSMLGFSTLGGAASATTYYKVATLPISTAGTFDQITMVVNFNDNWGSGANRCGTFVFGNRNSFSGKFLRLEGGVPTAGAKVLAYTETDGSVSVYLSTTTGFYATIAAEVLTSNNVTLYPSPTGVTSVTGTLAFDSSTATPVICTDTSSNVLFGTTNAASPTSGIAIIPGTGLNSAITIAHANTAPSGNFYIGFNYNGTNIGGVAQSGTTSVVYNTTSDIRLKKNIVEAPSAVEKVKAMQVRSFDWKADDSHVEHGFIAQELNTVEPLAVTEGETWQIDPSKLVATLTKALQEALSEIDSLKARVAALEI